MSLLLCGLNCMVAQQVNYLLNYQLLLLSIGTHVIANAVKGLQTIGAIFENSLKIALRLRVSAI